MILFDFIVSLYIYIYIIAFISVSSLIISYIHNVDVIISSQKKFLKNITEILYIYINMRVLKYYNNILTFL